MPRVVPPIEGRTAQHPAALSPSIVETAAGFTAGIVSTLVVHPFDVVKTRLQVWVFAVRQVQRTRWGDTWRVTSELMREEVRGRAFYRGLMPNMIGNSVSWALYFLWYGNLKDMLLSLRGEDAQLASSDYFVASGVSGILTAVCTNPIWVIKTRMLSTARNAPGAYSGIVHGAREIWRCEGVPGFYRGLIPSLFGVSHGAIQFMAYEQLKNHWAKSRGSKDNLTNLDYVNLSAISKAFAGTVTYPYQVLRTRLQIKDEATGTFLNVRGVARAIWKQEGIGGFYRGLGPNIVRVLPSTCVTFLVYENTKHYLTKIYNLEEAAEET
ncbi:MAG: hypothetical protein M1822_002197 [Bathelium mastoideum]|nr:MAG: hypothetical protein M1822_002197 [Bathelium mastoideum]